jgi:hypothetical protein
MHFEDTFQNTLNGIANVLLKIIVFLVILFIGWLIARALDSLVTKLLSKVGFDRLSDKTGLRRWTGAYTPSSLVGRVVRYIIILFTLLVAFAVFGPNPITALLNSIIAWLPKLIVALVIIVVAVAVANAVFDIISNAMSRFPYGKGLARAVQIIIITLGAIAALNQIGIATSVTMPVLITVLATIGGILIVGVGGGLIMPMRHRWEKILGSAEAEINKMRSGSEPPPPPPTA